MPGASANWQRSSGPAGCNGKVFLRKTTLLDYPGKVASVLFFPFCNLRCPWCQNRELVLGRGGAFIPLEEALLHLEKRRPVLGGVVLSGGEPTGFAGLPSLVETIRGMGLPVKLDTNGMNPPALEKLFSCAGTRPDYVALDLKLPPERYASLLPRGSGLDPGAALKQSALLVRKSGIDHEYRTLALPGDYFEAEELAGLAPLADSGPWYFRSFVPGNCLDPAWDSFPAPGAGKAALFAGKARALGKQGIAL